MISVPSKNDDEKLTTYMEFLSFHQKQWKLFITEGLGTKDKNNTLCKIFALVYFLINFLSSISNPEFGIACGLTVLTCRSASSKVLNACEC